VVGQPLKGHSDAVWGLAFSRDGQRIITASRDNTARIWDAGTGLQIGDPLTGHTDWVYRAAFSPDGKRIITASADGTARIWDGATGKTIGELGDRLTPVRTAAFSPDGAHVVTAAQEEVTRVWDAFTETQALVRSAKAAVPRCLTPAERSAVALPTKPPEWCVDKWPYNTPEWKRWWADIVAGKTRCHRQISCLPIGLVAEVT
jgi:WD40 repeat protein